MLSNPTSTLGLCGAVLFLLFASSCDISAIGDDAVTVRVTAQDVNSGEPVPNARVGLGYDRFGLRGTWSETSETDANGQVVFERAECERSSLLVNAFGATAANGRHYGPTEEYITCEPGEHSVTLDQAQY